MTGLATDTLAGIDHGTMAAIMDTVGVGSYSAAPAACLTAVPGRLTDRRTRPAAWITPNLAAPHVTFAPQRGRTTGVRSSLQRSNHDDLVLRLRTIYLSPRFYQPTEDTIMKTLFAIAAVGLGLITALSPASSQPYRDRDYGYNRDRDYGYNRDRDYGYRGFDEREYLRCNPDVLAAVYRGEFASGFEHYQRHGLREGRRISCR